MKRRHTIALRRNRGCPFAGCLTGGERGNGCGGVGFGGSGGAGECNRDEANDGGQGG